MRQLLHFSILFLIFIGCHNPNDQLLTFDLSKLPEIREVTLTDLGFNDIQYIPIETNDQSMMSAINPILFPTKIIFGEKFFLVKNQNSLLKFNLDGSFATKIGTIGRGPNEYIALSDVNIETRNQQIYLLTRSPTMNLFITNSRIKLSWVKASLDILS